LFIVEKDAEGEAKENIEPINQKDIPYPEKCLKTVRCYIAGSYRLSHTSIGRQSVKSDKNQEKQIAGRSTPRVVKCV